LIEFSEQKNNAESKGRTTTFTVKKHQGSSSRIPGIENEGKRKNLTLAVRRGKAESRELSRGRNFKATANPRPGWKRKSRRPQSKAEVGRAALKKVRLPEKRNNQNASEVPKNGPDLMGKKQL